MPASIHIYIYKYIYISVSVSPCELVVSVCSESKGVYSCGSMCFCAGDILMPVRIYLCVCLYVRLGENVCIYL